MASTQKKAQVVEELTGFRYKAAPVADVPTTSALKSSTAVRSFLGHHPFLVPLLQEMADRLHDYFADAPVLLELVTDPEEDRREQLAVSIVTDLPPNDALDRLSQFDRDWWLVNLDRAQGKISVDVAFQ